LFRGLFLSVILEFSLEVMGRTDLGTNPAKIIGVQAKKKVMPREEQETNEDNEQTTVVKVVSVISHMFYCTLP